MRWKALAHVLLRGSTPMNVAHLTVEAQRSGTIRYRLSNPARQDDARQIDATITRVDLERYHRSARKEWLSARVTGDAGMIALVQRFVDLAIPHDLEAALREWVSAATLESSAAGVSPGISVPTLCIQCNEPLLTLLPWEMVPMAIGLREPFVVRAPWSPQDSPAAPMAARLLFRSGTNTGELPPPSRLLVIGAGRERGRSGQGASRETIELPARFKTGNLGVAVMDGLEAGQIRKGLRAAPPAALHLAPIAANTDNCEPAVLFRGQDGTATWLPVAQLCDMFSQETPPGLVVVNAGPDGVSAARLLSQKASVVAVGWLGSVGGGLAADFALFFYERLLEYEMAAHGALLTSASVAGAVCAFVRHLSLERAVELGSVPVVWTPSPLHVAVHLPSPDPSSGAGGNLGNSTSRPTKAMVDLVLPPVINPALLANGEQVVDRLSVTLDRPEENIRLRITCDTGSGASTVHRTLSLPLGASPIDTASLQFPALHNAIQAHGGRRRINFTVSVLCGADTLAEETRTTVCMANNEWIDSPRTLPFLPSFVLPQSEAVLEVIGHSQRVLHILLGPEGHFSAYANDDRERVRVQMKALFQTLQQEPYRLAYVPPPPDLVYAAESADSRVPMKSCGQVVRMPEEVVKRRRGTCHDLSLLMAACAEQVGIHAVVVLVRGHTFVGYWTDRRAHTRFWKRAGSPGSSPDARGGREEPFGARWLLTAKDLERLVDDRVVDLVEATFVTKGKSFEEACKEGADQLFSHLSQGFDGAVDIHASRKHILPIS